MRILLTGANGQVGRCLRRQKPEHWEMIAADSSTLDITNAAAITNMVQNFEPDVIINAAGYTNLNCAESESAKVFAVNAQGVCNLAEAAANARIRFIHISSDYVFDGNKKSPYTETDSPNPLSIYAKSKLAGELLALSVNPDSTIIRSSWVFSEYGNNFVKDLVRQTLAGDVYAVSDKTGCPTYAGDLAKLMINLAQEPSVPRGIFHYCGDTAVNRYEFAQAVYEIVNTILPQTSRVLPLEPENEATPRPDYSVLSCDKIHRRGYQSSDWRTALQQILPAIVTEIIAQK